MGTVPPFPGRLPAKTWLVSQAELGRGRGKPGMGLVSAPLLPSPSCHEKLFASVYHICLCPGDSDCACQLAGLQREGVSVQAGQQAWFWLREGWHLPSLSPAAWTEFPATQDRNPELNLPQLGSHHHLIPGWGRDDSSQDPFPGSHGRLVAEDGFSISGRAWSLRP